MRDRVPATSHSNWPTQRLTGLLVLLSVLTYECVVGNGERSTSETLAIVALESGLVLFGWWLRARYAARWLSSPSSERVAILSVAGAGLLLEVGVRSLSHSMLPLELLLVSGIRNAVLAVTVLAYQAVYQRLASILAVFLVIFATALSSEWWLQGFVVLFAISGVWWLMGGYWESLRPQLVAHSSRELPRRWFIFVPLLMLLILLATVGTGTQAVALSGFLPSSGGTGGASDTARNGVGDGNALVAGTENIRSFAPIEDAPFVTSHEPSLYDLFDDTYDEAVKPQKQDRAIALPPQFGNRQKDHHLAQSKQAGKEFSTLRKRGEQQSKKLENLDSRALLYVQGRTPLHLKLEAFDLYDGSEWFPEPLEEHPLRLTMEPLSGRPWLRVDTARCQEIYGLPENHALKVIGLDTNHVPSPTQLVGVHIDQLDQVEMFGWAQPGILKMERDKLPALTVLHVQSRVVDREQRNRVPLPSFGGVTSYRQFGDDPQSQRVTELARQWVAGVPSGWPQVEAIVSRVRQEYLFDPEARPALESRHTVAEFLFESRRGPDYQFAGATVWLLRSLGYPARLVSGFYVKPERYDRRGRHTPVFAEDVHFWVEVQVSRDDWVPVEPTPGYEVLGPPPTLWQRLLSLIHTFALALWRNIALVLSVGVAVSVLLVFRREVVDSLQMLIWKWRPARDERARVLQTLRLLDARCRRGDRRCPAGIPFTRWLTEVSADLDPGLREELRRFVRAADWACFAPEHAPQSQVSLEAICSTVVTGMTLRSLRRPSLRTPPPQKSIHWFWPLARLRSVARAVSKVVV